MMYGKLQWNNWWIVFGAYVLLLVGLYYSASSYLWLQWQLEDNSYGMLVPCIVLYLLWDQREQLRKIPAKSSATGMVFLVFGLLFFWLGELGGEYTSLFFSFWLIVIGLCLLHLGWPRVRRIGFALFLTLFMFPLPNIIMGEINFKLKLISSQVGVKMLHLYGMSAYREGNIIDLGFTQLQVVDACSGLRFLLSIIIMGLLLGYFFRLPYWKWALLMAITVPVTILSNGLRIAVTGVLFEFFGPVVAEGFFHDFAGWFTFMTALAMLLSPLMILRRGGKRKIAPVVDGGAEERSVRSPSIVLVTLVFVLLSGSLVASQGVEFREVIPLKKNLKFFPLSVGDWQGRSKPMSQVYLDALDLSDYVMIDYWDTARNHIDFYVAYYESQRKGESIHSPSTCLPGSGWELKRSADIFLQVPDRVQPVRIMRTEMHLGDRRQLAYYWFFQRGRYLTKAYELKLYGFWDALTKKRTDGALVRIIITVPDGEKVVTAEQRLIDFTLQVIPLLDQYLPGKEG